MRRSSGVRVSIIAPRIEGEGKSAALVKFSLLLLCQENYNAVKGRRSVDVGVERSVGVHRFIIILKA